MSEQLPHDDRLVAETRRFYGGVFQTAWRTVALSSAIVLFIVFFNSELFVLSAGGGREYIRFAVRPGEGLAFLGVLSALVIALVVEVDQSARLLSRPDRHQMSSEELGLSTVRLRIAQWTSTALGYGAVLCGLIVVFTSEEEVFEARAALTALAALLVFAFTLLVNLAAENAQHVLRELNRRATEMMFGRIQYWIGQLPVDDAPMNGWRRALSDFWTGNGSKGWALARDVLLRLARLGIIRSFAAVMGVLVVTMVVTGFLFGWGALIWVGISGLIWLGAASVGEVLVVRDILAGARALPTVELLFLSFAGLILSVLVWISSGGTMSDGLVSLGARAGILAAMVPGLLFAVFVAASAAWLMLAAVGAYGRRWLTERVANGLERRGRILGDSLTR